MEIFYITVITIACIVLIISLATMGVVIQKGSRSGAFPPIANNCPDGWTTKSETNSITNEITYTCTAPSDYKEKEPASSDGLTVRWSDSDKTISYNDSTTTVCDKRKWATKHNIMWDGVSNYNSC